MNLAEQAQVIFEKHFLEPLSRAISAIALWFIVYWDRVLIAVSFAIAAGYYLYIILITHHFFWDFQLYSAAIKSMAAGASPYDHPFIIDDTNFPFLYAPLVAKTFLKLSWLFITPVGLAVLLIIHTIGWLSIPYLLAGSPKYWYSRNFLCVFGLFLILFGLGGLKMFASGNIAGVQSALMIFSIALAIRTRDYKLFWVTILICSFIKIYFLAFLLFPIILDKKYFSAIALIVALVGLYAIDYALHPQLFQQFVTVIAQVSGADMVGRSLYSLLVRALQLVLGSEHRGLTLFALGVHFIFVAVIALLAYAVAKRHPRPMQFDLFSCWIFMSACLISPRLLDYDVALLVVPFVLLGQMLLKQPSVGIGIAAIVAALGFVFMRTPLSDWSGTIALVGVWLGACVQWLVAGKADGLEEVKC